MPVSLDSGMLMVVVKQGTLWAALRVAMESQSKLIISLKTVRPVRLAIAATAITVFMFGWALVIDQGVHQYRLWRAGGTWCATLHPNGTVTRYYGDEACGY